MSGPKTSRYTLTAEQRRILAEQRRIEMQKAVAKEKVRSYSKRILQIRSLFSGDKAISEELISRIGNDGGFCKKIEDLRQLISPCETIILNTDTDDLATLENTVESVSSCIVKADALVNEISLIAAENENKLRSDIAKDIDKGFETSFADIRIETDAQKMRQKLCLQLEELNRNVVLTDKNKEEIRAALIQISEIKDEIFFKNYVALSIKPLIKKCNDFLVEYEQYHLEFESLYAEYTALCELYFFVAQEYECSAESIAVLKDEIKRINEIVAYDDEQGYISDCIDEVMEEMGYSVLGSREVTKKNGKRFKNELYTYGEGTAVNVTYSSDGKIAMELGGIDSSDRLPDSNEAVALCNAMESFCDDFKEIEKRLAAKGVVLSDRISLLPPGAEYAQIINTSDYQMNQEPEKLQVRKRHQASQKNKSMKVE